MLICFPGLRTVLFLCTIGRGHSIQSLVGSWLILSDKCLHHGKDVQGRDQSYHQKMNSFVDQGRFLFKYTGKTNKPCHTASLEKFISTSIFMLSLLKWANFHPQLPLSTLLKLMYVNCLDGTLNRKGALL